MVLYTLLCHISILDSLPAGVPQILINRERLHYLNFDVELLGNCDNIVAELCRRLGDSWDHIASKGPLLEQVLLSNLPTPPASPDQQLNSREENICSVGKSVEMDDTQVSSSSSVDFQGASNSCISVKATESGSGDSSHAGPSTDKLSSKEHHHHHHHHHHNHHHPKSQPKLVAPSYTEEPDIVEESVSSSSVAAGNSSANQHSSEQDLDRLVSAGHKKDVVYEPDQGSSTSHHHHHHHNHHHHHQHHHHHHHQESASSSHSGHTQESHQHHHHLGRQGSQSPSHRTTVPPGVVDDQHQRPSSGPSQHAAQIPESTLELSSDSALRPSTSYAEKKRLHSCEQTQREEPEVKKPKLYPDTVDSNFPDTLVASETRDIPRGDSVDRVETVAKMDGACSNPGASVDMSNKDETDCNDDPEENGHGETGEDDLEELQRAFFDRPRVSIAERLASKCLPKSG